MLLIRGIVMLRKINVLSCIQLAYASLIYLVHIFECLMYSLSI